MSSLIGTSSLVLTVLAAGGVMLTSVASIRFEDDRLLRHARRGFGVVAALLTLASAALLYALINSNFQLAYVVGYTEWALPFGYKLAAFWAGQEGSLLLWAWLLGVMGLIVAIHQRRRSGVEPAVTLAVMAVVTGFFALLMIFAADPFELRPEPAADGHGLNPLLQHPSMVAHPPLLFIGYAAATVPFAMLIGGLAAGRSDRQWLDGTRRWLLVTWLFLTVGILLGAQWAYVELGWGGYWAWDPVENASLLPWLTATAALHSIVMQRKRGMYKRWSAGLIAATFILCLLATYLTRSGIVQSVHAFGASLVGSFFLAFMILSIVGTAGVLIWRRSCLKPEQPLERLISHDGAFLAVNVLLVIITATVLIGTIFPVLSSAVGAEAITVKPAFYNTVVLPMAMVLLALMAVGPLLRAGWSNGADLFRKLRLPMLAGAIAASVLAFGFGVSGLWSAAAAFVTVTALGVILADLAVAYRQHRQASGHGAVASLLSLLDGHHRRYGGQIVHVGMLMLLVGTVGSSLFNLDRSIEMTPGQMADFGGYQFTFEQVGQKRMGNYTAVQAHVRVAEPAGGVLNLHPQIRYYDKSQQPHAEVALRWSLWRDVYVTLLGTDRTGSRAAFQVYINPLVSWIWLGGIVMTIGGLFSLSGRLIPERAFAEQAAPAARPRTIHLAPTPCEQSSPSLEIS